MVRRVGVRLLTSVAVAAAPLAVVALTPSAAHADEPCGVTGNLVSNCGFGSWDYNNHSFAGWTFSGPTEWAAGWSHTGDSTYAAIVGFEDPSGDSLSQTVSGTTPGATYEVGFWAESWLSTNIDFTADALDTASGTTTIVDSTPPNTWTYYSASFVAGASAPTIRFSGLPHDQGGIVIDDVTVVAAGPAPVVLPSAAPGGTYGAAYSQSLAATGGTAPYIYTVSAGTLPAGLTLDPDTGLLHGTPTAAGDADFTVTATDSGDPAQTSTQAYTLTVAKADPVVTVIEPVVGGVVGETADLDASSTSSEGSLSFLSDTPATCEASVTSVTYLHPGSCTVEATQAASANYNAASATSTVPVAGAATTTAVHVHPTSISADVAVVAPGHGSPTGTVTFSVGGDVVGTAPVTAHTATLAYVVPAGATRQVAAVYSGDTDFTGSSDSTSRSDPTITAKVTSYRAVSSFGWYHTPIRVAFTCTTAGAPLTTSCPAPVTIDHDVAGRSVTRTILATDGGADTVTVGALNLDQHAPAVRVSGVRDGAVYNGRAPAAHCVATDGLSGVASCRITRHTVGSVTSYVAIAADRAGNTSRTHGSYRVLSTYLVGAPLRHGAFQVRRHSYSLMTHASTRPHYVYAAPAPARPHGGNTPFPRIGRHTWAITVSFAGLSRGSAWNLGIRVGGTLRIVKIHVR